MNLFAGKVAFVAVAVLLGCSAQGGGTPAETSQPANAIQDQPKQSTNQRVEVKTPSGKKITVLENPNKFIYNELALKKIDRYENVRGMDFYNDNQLLVVKDNQDIPPVSVEGEKTYAKNLYLYHTQTKKAELLYGGPFFHRNAQYSPDKKYIYYTQGFEETGTGYVMDKHGKNRVRVSDRGAIHIFAGGWLNDREVLYATFFGDIYRADVNGKKTLLVKTGKTNLANAKQIGSKLYYTTVDNQLRVHDLNTKKTQTIKKNVVWLIPSPDKKQFAMVLRIGETKMALVLTDLQGKQKAKLAEGTQIYGTSWSPDQSKLAFTVTSEKRGQQGLFVTDLKSLKSIQLSADLQTIADPIKWDRSSKKLLASTIGEKDLQAVFTTYVITLK